MNITAKTGIPNNSFGYKRKGPVMEIQLVQSNFPNQHLSPWNWTLEDGMLELNIKQFNLDCSLHVANSKFSTLFKETQFIFSRTQNGTSLDASY